MSIALDYQGLAYDFARSVAGHKPTFRSDVEMSGLLLEADMPPCPGSVP